MLQAINSLDSITGVKAAAQLRSLRSKIEQEIGRVADVVLFGSRARGDARRGSDYDIAVLISPDQDQHQIDRAVTALALPFIRAGFHFRPIVLTNDLFDQADLHPLARNIVRDGVSIR
ncbi:nucleotidyltransferase family protein [Sphingobium sp. YR768]|uniref:nucleotidyltransferase family protein n=1 Tax=Sphingobium sp. YR768 TaxID=1884365 RepID=UPI001C433C71|nr:nucleotidyltransferase domain-containing protein [Sphingobium sp. YR768]